MNTRLNCINSARILDYLQRRYNVILEMIFCVGYFHVYIFLLLLQAEKESIIFCFFSLKQLPQGMTLLQMESKLRSDVDTMNKVCFVF